MARARARNTAPPKPPKPNSLIASAVRLVPGPGATTPNKPRGQSQEWQAEGWYFLDTCGELAFAASWFANALSRVRLYIRTDGPDGEGELDEGTPVDALHGLTGGPSGTPILMAALGMHLFTPGECYLIGQTVGDPPEDRDVWAVYSTDEVKQQGANSTKWQIDRGDGVKTIIDTSEDADRPAVVIRIWRSHARMWVEATSPVRAVLPILRELEGLTKQVGASIDSRLAGAGLLLIPSEMTFGSPPTSPDTGEDPDATPPEAPAADPENDPFMIALTEAMVTPIRDRGNASAVVPIVIRAPGALIGNAQHIKFSTPLDEKAAELRTECIRRLALGLDMPPEILLGTGDVNHWGAWQIDEAALKTHIEPACELITAALTTRYLFPVLEGLGISTVGLSIGYDTSDLRLRPNRTEEAFQLFDRQAIDYAALLRETGFEEGDVPDAAELRTQLLLKIANGTVTPDLTAAALAELGIDLAPAPSTVEAEQVPAPAELPAPPPPPETDPQNTREPPEQQAASLLATSEPMVSRAIERANNRVNNRAKNRRAIPGDRMADAMRGAFDGDMIARCAGLLGVDGDTWTAAMERYTTAVLATGQPHVPAVLDRLLRETVLSGPVALPAAPGDRPGARGRENPGSGPEAAHG